MDILAAFLKPLPLDCFRCPACAGAIRSKPGSNPYGLCNHCGHIFIYDDQKLRRKPRNMTRAEMRYFREERADIPACKQAQESIVARLIG